MSSSKRMEIDFKGNFSLGTSAKLAASAHFINYFPKVSENKLYLAFPLEGSWSAAGVRLEMINGNLFAEIRHNPGRIEHDEIIAQVKRMLSLDTDGSDYEKIITKDSAIKTLLESHPGIRPILYSTPYEAAARAIIMHRLYANQAAAVTQNICKEYGERVDMDDMTFYSFPPPEVLANLPEVKGLAERKIDQLKQLGAQVSNGFLNTEELRKMETSSLHTHLKKLAGIGPFSSELIEIRGLGNPDVFPVNEKSLQRAMAATYNLGNEPDLKKLEEIAEKWKPYRSWAGLLLRNFYKELLK